MSHSFPDRIIPTLASPSLVNKGANITPLTNPYLLPTMPTLNLVLLNGRLLSTFFFFFCSALHSLFHPNVLIWITDFLILIRCQHWWPLTLSLPYSVPPSYQYPAGHCTALYSLHGCKSKSIFHIHHACIKFNCIIIFTMTQTKFGLDHPSVNFKRRIISMYLSTYVLPSCT